MTRRRPLAAALEPAALGRVVVVSPHDDDANIGCGGLIQALPAPPLVIVVTDGRLGYQSAAEKDGIVALRRREAEDSYVRLGVPLERMVFLGFPDMSLRPYQCWETPDGRPGAYQRLLRLFRDERAETVLLPNAGDFHPDHQAAHEAGQVAAVQARETLMPDQGPPAPIRQVLAYQVWEALERPAWRLALDETQAERKRHSLRAYRSQGPVIEDLLRRQTLSFAEERFAELRRFPPRSSP